MQSGRSLALAIAALTAIFSAFNVSSSSDSILTSLISLTTFIVALMGYFAIKHNDIGKMQMFASYYVDLVLNSILVLGNATALQSEFKKDCELYGSRLSSSKTCSDDAYNRYQTVLLFTLIYLMVEFLFMSIIVRYVVQAYYHPEDSFSGFDHHGLELSPSRRSEDVEQLPAYPGPKETLPAYESLPRIITVGESGSANISPQQGHSSAEQSSSESVITVEVSENDSLMVTHDQQPTTTGSVVPNNSTAPRDSN
ncbi:hypothetical protein HDV02_001473 [Globomyces sp. JEL0801]|nr:hypothetical protein HDV02_001473 [Globomyces sp. JEL0801]